MDLGVEILDITREHIKQSNLIEGVRDSDEVDRSLVAWSYLREQEELTLEVVLEVHQLIMRNLWRSIAGKLRQNGVMVHGALCPHYSEVPALLNNWLVIYKEHTPKSAHIGFELIHPFRDGNGRTGRMLMWWHEIQLGKKPTIITFDGRFDYFEWFKRQ